MSSDGARSRGSVGSSFMMTALCKTIHITFPAVNGMTTDELEQLMDAPDRLTLFDVRSEEEFCVSHVPSAIRVDPELTDMAQLMASIPRAQAGCHSVVFYCSLGYRSSTMAARLDQFRPATLTAPRPDDTPQEEEEGAVVRLNTYNLDGGIFKWANEGRPIVDSENKPANKVHHFSEIWGKYLNKDLRYKP